MRPRHLLTLLVLLALVGPAPPAHADAIVSVCDEAHLLAAIAGGGTVTFSCSGTITLTAEITIAADTTIDGSGQTVTISGNGAVRVFLVNSGVTLSLNELTVANGFAIHGGGINNNGTLIVSNSTFAGNSATLGGGIRNDHGGTLIVSNSTFAGNSAGTYYGGGIESELGGTVTVSNSTFSGNSAYQGGGIYIPGDYYLVSATLKVSNSTFSGNRASFGGGIASDGMVTVSNSTFSGNSADYGGGIAYGGHYSTLTVSNSTFSGNSASGEGGGINNSGAITVTNSTFAGNGAGQQGGGIHNDWNGTVTLNNTIVANSTTGGDCAGAITDGGGNLSFPGTTCPGIHSNPNLGPLQNNLGPTYTMALLPGSAAIDAGYDAICAAPPVNNRDQRGIARPQGPHCDIGAYEATLQPILPRAFLPMIMR